MLAEDCKGLWPHSAVNSCDLVRELLSALWQWLLWKAWQTGSHSLRVFSILWCILSSNPGPWEQPLTLATEPWQRLGESCMPRRSPPFAIYWDWTFSYSAENLPTWTATRLRAPFVPKDPTCTLHKCGRESIQDSEWVGLKYASLQTQNASLC